MQNHSDMDRQTIKSPCSTSTSKGVQVRLNSVAKQYVSAVSIGVTFQATYHPRSLNHLADMLTRQLDPHEWSLDHSVLQTIFGLDMDLFASPENAKCPTFCSICPSQHCWAADAFAIDWSIMPFCFFH